MVWLAKACSAWGWMCRSSSERSTARPLGNTDSACVRAANAMVSRSAILILLCCAKYVLFGLEQPASSIMILHHRMQQIVKLAKKFPDIITFQELHTYMGAFRAPTAKPTRLYLSTELGSGLKRSLPKGFRREEGSQTATKECVTGNDGRKRFRVNGCLKNLKASQAYTQDFGRAVYQSFAARTKKSNNSY